MDAEEATKIQQECLEQMKKGGMTPIERNDCFAKFETTIPNADLVKQFYDVWAADYDVDMIAVDYKNPGDIVVELDKLFPDADDKKKAELKILDVGAGTGEGGKLLKKAGYTNIDATDGSPGMLELAKKLNVYTNVLEAELLEKGQKMKTVPADSYDIVASSGSFYPFHLQGYHLDCFYDRVKVNGYLVLSSCPASDKNVNLKPAITKLEADGFIKVLKETYVPKWYREDDGLVFTLQRLK